MRNKDQVLTEHRSGARSVLRFAARCLLATLVGLSQACGGGGGGGGGSGGSGAVLALDLTTPLLPDGAAATAYSATLSAKDGDATAYTWSVIAGALPPGLVLGSSGVPSTTLSGTPLSPGTFNFTVLVRDGSGGTDSQSYSVEIRPALSVTTASLTPAVAGTAFSRTISAAGGSGLGYQWALASGSLPSGVTVAASGTPSTTISGTPAAGGSFPFTVQVTDTSGVTATRALTLDVRTPPTITTASPLPATFTSIAYSTLITATGGSGTGYVWGRAAGTLPPGLSIPSPATGTSLRISGTPNTAGTFSFSLEVVDSDGSRATKAFSVTVSANVQFVTATPLQTAIRSAPYTASFTASGGSGSGYVFSVSGGSLPVGLTLSAGVISGTPTVKATTSFTMRVVDSIGNTATKGFAITVNDPLAMVAGATPTGTAGVPYAARFFADQGMLAGYAWSVTAGSLPPGVAFVSAETPSARLGGIPTSAGTFPFTLTVSDSAGNTTSTAASITIGAATSPLEMTTRIIPSAVSGSAYSVALAGRGGAGSLAWTTSGGLPPGLTLASDGTLSGTPATPGCYAFTVTLSDGATSLDRELVVIVKRAPRFVAYTSDQETTGVKQVYIGDIDGASTPAPARNPWPSFAAAHLFSNADSLQFSPDNGKLAFTADLDVDGENDLYVVDLRGAAPSPAVLVSAGATTVNASAQVRFVWSPDSSHIAFSVAGSAAVAGALWLSDVSDPASPGAPRPLTSAPSLRGLIAGQQALPGLPGTVGTVGFGFSPDGSKVAFLSDEANGTAGNWDLRIADVAGVVPTFQQNPALGGDRVAGFFWTDSDHVCFAVRAALANSNIISLHLADVGGSGAGQQVAVDAPLTFSGISTSGTVFVAPDGRRLALATPNPVATSRKEVVLVDLERMSPTPTAARLNVPYTGTFENLLAGNAVVWSPDARRLAYKAAERGSNLFDIFVVDVIGGIPGGPQVASTQPLAPFFATGNAFSWSPDGRRLAMQDTTARQHVHVVDVSGLVPGTEQAVSTNLTTVGTPTFVTFSPDSRKLSFRADGRLQNEFELWVSDLYGPSPTVPLMVNPIPVIGGNVSNQIAPAWSRDSTRIYYIADLQTDNYNDFHFTTVTGAPFTTTRLSAPIVGQQILSGASRGMSGVAFQN